MADHVFICYARRDFPFVSDLARALHGRSLSIWFDVLDMSAGENYLREIDTAIASASHVAVVVSPNSMASAEVQREIEVALRSGKKIVPLLLQAVVMPVGLRSLQWIDFRRDFELPLGMLADYLRGERPLADAALVLRSLPRPLNVGDSAPLFEIDCPLMVKIPLFFVCTGALLIMNAAILGVGDNPVFVVLGLGLFVLVTWFSFLTARRKLAYRDALTIAILSMIPVVAAVIGWRYRDGWSASYVQVAAAAVSGAIGAGLIVGSGTFRRWMVAYSREPGRDYFPAFLIRKQ